ncbi:MAG: DUF3329 domain-containing protein [Rhizobiaceae bacterium]
MDIIGASHPFFRPAVRRYSVVAVCLIWTAVEWTFGDAFWGIISGGIFGLAAYELLWTYDERHGAKTESKDVSPDAKP